MTLLEALAILVAGLLAGTINTIVGSGTLITFPTLLFLGYPPVQANISNSLGLVAGGISGAWGYRREMVGLQRVLLTLLPASFLGAVAGALLLLVLPESAFEAIVPVLIALALVLVVTGPRLSRWAAAHSTVRPGIVAGTGLRHGVGTARLVGAVVGVFLAGVYGGYFGAAQGVLLIGIMSMLLPLGLQQINGVKNVLGLVVNLVAALVFLVIQPEQIDWAVVGLIAAGSLVGGVVGARIGRSLPPWVLRSVIVVIGVVAIAVLLT